MINGQETLDDAQKSKATEKGRSARISNKQNGSPLGAAIWLSASQLANLGVAVDTTDKVVYQVEDGSLQINAGEEAGTQ